METLISTPAGIVAGLAIIVALTLYLQKYKFFKFLGPVMTCIIFGIVISNLKILPFQSELYGPFFTYGIPLTITMFLVSVNIRDWAKLAKQPIIAMLLAALSVFVVGILSGILFAGKVDEGWKIIGMFVGTYIGGSANLTAVGTGLEASPAAFAAANAADYVVGLPIMIFLFALPNIFLKSNFFKKMWPYSLSDEELYSGEEGDFFDDKQWSIQDVAILFMLGFVVNALATRGSQFFGQSIRGAMRVILMTTFALAFGQIKFFNRLRGGQELGIFISLFYLAAIGLGIDLRQFASSAPLIAVMCAVVSFGSVALHLLLCKLFKIPYQYIVSSITAAIVDGPTSALVCSSAGWSGIVPTAIVLGAFGGALGNYLGISTSYIIKAFHGIM